MLWNVCYKSFQQWEILPNFIRFIRQILFENCFIWGLKSYLLHNYVPTIELIFINFSVVQSRVSEYSIHFNLIFFYFSRISFTHSRCYFNQICARNLNCVHFRRSWYLITGSRIMKLFMDFLVLILEPSPEDIY